jgi:glycosyltransferase involved in cell wall biosynthesis
MKKTVNLLCSHYPPENTAASERLKVLASTLGEVYAVHVFALTERGAVSKPDDFSSGNLHVHYVWQKPYRVTNFFCRAFFEFYYAFVLVMTARRQKADVWVVSIPFMFLLPVAVFLGSCPVIADVRDLVWDYFPSKTFKDKLVKGVLCFIMRTSLRCCREIVVTNAFEQKKLLSTLDKEALLVSNGLSRERFELLSSLAYFSRRAENKGRFTILYAGNIGIAQNFNAIIDMVCEMPEVDFYLVGDGNKADVVRSYVQEKGAQNIFFTGKIPFAELSSWYERADMLFVCLAPGFETAMPSKLYECCVTGLPVLFEGGGVAADFLRDFAACNVVTYNDKAAMRQAIEKIMTKDPVLDVTGREKIAASFIREAESARYIDIVDKLLAD